jgi:TRAP-type uncharacterized transport system substrate-binding protein
MKKRQPRTIHLTGLRAKSNSLRYIIGFLFCALSCSQPPKSYTILGNIEDPQNEIAVTISNVLNKNLDDSVKVLSGIGSLANLDSLEAGRADFGIVDNYSRFSDDVTSVLPLYPQVLHILHRKEFNPKSLRDLFLTGKVFAGIEGSGTHRFVHELMLDLGIKESQCAFVDYYDYFEADVIFSFTDLLTMEELRDLRGYHLFSIDDVERLGKGSLAEGICTRHPQFEPYIIPRDLYGSFTEKAILTLKVDAILVCRADLDQKFVYKVIQTLLENAQDLKDINPLLYQFTSDFDPRKLNFTLHPATIDFLDRHEPSFFERYAELIGVIVSIFVALASTLYTISQWRGNRKKNKLDFFYLKLIHYRKQIPVLQSIQELKSLHQSLKDLQDLVLDLVAQEKIETDESLTIFLNLHKIVDEELQSKIRFFDLVPNPKLN